MGHITMVGYKYITGSTSEVASSIARSDIIALDLETTGLDPLTTQPRLLSVNAGGEVYVVDVFQSCLGPLLHALRDFDGITVGHNVKFDAKFLLHHYKLSIRNPFCTFRASHLIYNGKEPDSDDISSKWRHSRKNDGTVRVAHNLYGVIERELGACPSVEDLGASDWSGDLSSQQLDYAAWDVEMLPRLRVALRAKLVDLGLFDVACIEMGVIEPEAALELAGLGIDRDAWTALAKKNESSAAEIRKELLTTLPSPSNQLGLFGRLDWNIDSNEQMGESLRRMGIVLPDTKETTLAQVDHPVIKRILDYRGYNKSCTTYGTEFLKHINSKTGRIHTQLWPFTGAGRYASSSPNLQNAPRSKEFRACFVPETGHSFCISDYSAVELRTAAEISGDEKLISVFERGEDPHKQTAQLVLNKQDISKPERQLAKAIGFGFLYGMGHKKLPQYAAAGYGVKVSEHEAYVLRNKFFQAYPGLLHWHKTATAAKGPVRTLSGRLRYLADDEYTTKLNTPAQGSAADAIKSAMRNVYDRLEGKGRLVVTCHDELIVECPDSMSEECLHHLESGMKEALGAMLRRVPAAVEGGIGKSWAAK